MSTLTSFGLSTHFSTLTANVNLGPSHSFEVDLSLNSSTNRESKLTQKSHVSPRIASIANYSRP
jgi:hypothetical protein